MLAMNRGTAVTMVTIIIITVSEYFERGTRHMAKASCLLRVQGEGALHSTVWQKTQQLPNMG